MANSPGVRRVPAPHEVEIVGIDLSQSGELMADEPLRSVEILAGHSPRTSAPRVCYVLNQEPSSEWIAAFNQAEESWQYPFRAVVESNHIFVGFREEGFPDRHSSVEESVRLANKDIKQAADHQRDQENAKRERISQMQDRIARFAQDRGVRIVEPE